MVDLGGLVAGLTLFLGTMMALRMSPTLGTWESRGWLAGFGLLALVSYVNSCQTTQQLQYLQETLTLSATDPFKLPRVCCNAQASLALGSNLLVVSRGTSMNIPPPPLELPAVGRLTLNPDGIVNITAKIRDGQQRILAEIEDSRLIRRATGVDSNGDEFAVEVVDSSLDPIFQLVVSQTGVINIALRTVMLGGFFMCDGESCRLTGAATAAIPPRLDVVRLFEYPSFLNRSRRRQRRDSIRPGPSWVRRWINWAQWYIAG